MKFITKLTGSQLRLNVLSGAVSSIVGFVLSIIKYPIFLSFMGYELYGVWLVLTSVLSFAQLGLSSVAVGIVKLVAEEHGKKNLEDIEKYIATALAILLVVGLLLLTFSILFGRVIVTLIGISGAHAPSGITYLPFIALLSIYIFVYEIINATLSGLGRIDIANYSQTLIQAIPVVIAIPLFLLHIPSLASMLAAHFAAYIVITVANLFRIKQIVKLRLFRIGNVSFSHLAKLLSFSGAMFFSSLISLLFFPFSKIILSRQLGVAIVPIYEVAYRASYQLMTAFSLGLRALTPEISRLSAILREENEGIIKRINAKAYSITIFGGTIVCAIVFLMAETIFKLWLGKSFNAEIVTCFRIMISGTLACIVTLVPYYNLIGRGNMNYIVLYHGISPILSILVIYALMNIYRITLSGVALANSLGLMIGALYLIYTTVKLNHKNAINDRFAAIIK
jgi:O-antigen/teichoic acid export membrane protein